MLPAMNDGNSEAYYHELEILFKKRAYGHSADWKRIALRRFPL